MTLPPEFTTLVDITTLHAHLDDARWRVLDCRHDLADSAAGRRAYEAGHIPGARFAHLDDDLSGPKTGGNGRHPLPPRDALAGRLRAWGIDPGTQIVAYDAQGGSFAARLWWLARWMGHRAVAVLDGGWPAWTAAGGPVTTAAPVARAGTFAAGPSLVPVVTVDAVLAQLGTGARLVLDARAPERYSGAQEPIDPVGGHIPGARNRPWARNLGADGRWKTPAELRAELAQAIGALAPAAVIHQCGSGVTACHNLLAMELAGLPGGALYAGSWSEWCSDPQRPVERGEAV